MAQERGLRRWKKIRNFVGSEIGDGQEMKSPPFLGLRKGEPSAIRRPEREGKGEANGTFPEEWRKEQLTLPKNQAKNS
jgi:hypothetical protein